MNRETNSRGFRGITHDTYPPSDKPPQRVVWESSIVGDYDDALKKPGSSALWFGEHHHLNREEVRELRDALTEWLRKGRLPTGDSTDG